MKRLREGGREGGEGRREGGATCGTINLIAKLKFSPQGQIAVRGRAFLTPVLQVWFFSSFGCVVGQPRAA